MPFLLNDHRLQLRHFSLAISAIHLLTTKYVNLIIAIIPVARSYCVLLNRIETLACARKFCLYVYVYDETVAEMQNCVMRRPNVKCGIKMQNVNR